MSSKLTTLRVHYKDGVTGTHTVINYIPPDRSHFNYWVFYYPYKEGESPKCRFLNSDQVDAIDAQEVLEDGD